MTLEDLPVVDVNDGVECLVKNYLDFPDSRGTVFAETKNGRFLCALRRKDVSDDYCNPAVLCYKYAGHIQPKILPLTSVNDIPAWCFGENVIENDHSVGTLLNVWDNHEQPWCDQREAVILGSPGSPLYDRKIIYIDELASDRLKVIRGDRTFKLYREISE